MRSAKALLVAGLVIVGLPSLAQAQWYVGADAGAGFTEKSKVTGDIGSGLDTKYDTGWVGLVQGGYSFGGPKLELEFGYRNNSVDKVGGANGGNDLNVYSFMLNGIYDFNPAFMPASKWHPFLGAGVGLAIFDGGIKQNDTKVYNSDDTQFAYQGIAGVGYDLTNNWMIKAQYRYFATLDTSVKSTPAGVKGDASYATHNVLLGVTYKFGAAPAPEPVPPAPVAAPAPAVKPAPAPMRNYLVFFDFNKADITPEASRIIAQASTAAKGEGITRVNVTGHTDTVGSDKYNMALSLKRANAVKDAMVRQGVPADEIVVVGKGKSDPLVPTKDGVREPQNRRVEIVLQ